MKIRTAILLLLASIALAACGNRGPLVLPTPDDSEQVPADEADAEEPVDEDAGDEPESSTEPQASNAARAAGPARG